MKSFSKWLFAKTYDRVNERWERHLREHRRQVAGQAKGRVLEIGAGTGANLEFYGSEVEEITVAEPSPHMAELLREKAERLGRSLTVVPERAEELSLSSESFDSVVSTMVMCTVPELDRVMAHVRRVLKPGGAYYFFEHVEAPVAWKRQLQRLINPAWRLFTDGCNLDRDIRSAIRGAGFSEVEIRAFQAVGPPLQNPHIIGHARP